MKGRLGKLITETTLKIRLENPGETDPDTEDTKGEKFNIPVIKLAGMISKRNKTKSDLKFDLQTEFNVSEVKWFVSHNTFTNENKRKK